METIWQIDAYGKTLADAVREFCETYWGEPRKSNKIGSDGTFRVRGGTATYHCAFVDNIPGIYRVTRLLH